MPLFERNPENPILRPDAVSPWEAEAVFNPSVAMVDGVTHMAYRAESHKQRVGDVDMCLSTIGHATEHHEVPFDSRRQLLWPEHAWERYGLEDPRLSFFEGMHYVFYTALSAYPFGPDSIRLAGAVSSDLKIWEKHPVTPFNAKAGALFPERVGGRIAMILTADTDQPPAKIAVRTFDDVDEIWDQDGWNAWYHDIEEHRLRLVRRPDDHVEVGAAPVLTPDGWLLLYSYIRDYFHGDVRTFGIEAALLDRDDPRKIIARSEHALLRPEEPYELYGRVPNVIFPSGARLANGRVHMYYGASDTTACEAVCDLDALLQDLRSPPIQMERHEGNPILEPRPAIAWESKATFNPGAVQAGGRVALL